MLYAALTLWLLVIVFSAWGTYALWTRLVKPRFVNAALLPGTLVAQLGYVFGLLVTGNSVRNTALMRDDEAGEPQAEAPDKMSPPVIGPIVIGLMPLLACGAALYVVAMNWGRGVLRRLWGDGALEAAKHIPTSLEGCWGFLHGGLNAAEAMLNALLHRSMFDWWPILFVYLSICLTVRMTPFENNRRGAIGAIFLAGVVIWLLGSFFPTVEEAVESSWPLLSFSVAMLLFLLIVSLAVTGVVGLIRILVRKQ